MNDCLCVRVKSVVSVFMELKIGPTELMVWLKMYLGSDIKKSLKIWVMSIIKNCLLRLNILCGVVYCHMHTALY